jgi:hypothetical protein
VSSFHANCGYCTYITQEFLPGKRAIAIGLCIYHVTCSTVLYNAPRFIPYSLGPLAERCVCSASYRCILLTTITLQLQGHTREHLGHATRSHRVWFRHLVAGHRRHRRRYGSANDGKDPMIPIESISFSHHVLIHLGALEYLEHAMAYTTYCCICCCICLQRSSWNTTCSHTVFCNVYFVYSRGSIDGVEMCLDTYKVAKKWKYNSDKYNPHTGKVGSKQESFYRYNQVACRL